MTLALVFALVGIGVLQLDRHPLSTFRLLPVTARILFVCALIVALVDQAGI